MDPVTHTAVGLTIAQAGGKRLTENWAWVIVLAASAPDGDFFFARYGSLDILPWHRNFTHSLAFAPVLALAVVVFVRYVLRREVQLRGAFVLALLGVLSHDLLDFLTFRGTRLLMPFSDEVFALQIASYRDPGFYVLLALGFAVPMLSNLVNQEIGSKKSSGIVSAWVSICLCVTWFVGRFLFHEQAVAELNSRIYNGRSATRVEALATMNPFRFVGLVDSQDFQKILEVHLLEAFDPEDGQPLYRPVPSVEAGRALRIAGNTRSAQIFLAWSRWPRWQVIRMDGETRWVVSIEDIATEPDQKRPRVVIKLDENYAIQSEVYERVKGFLGL
ncbi:MAG: metal-dependent hydrolase [Acidobacteria bacterium]|nr:metal-dependent hydrolase [Acidobacteriota bacterium]